MSNTVTTPYGAWPSPISAADVARARIRLAFPTGADGHVWWQEVRPGDGTTTVVHRSPDGHRRALLHAPWSAQSRVHEYGGASYLPVPTAADHAPAGPDDGVPIVFANQADQRLYLLVPGATGAAGGTGNGAAGPGARPRPLTPAPAIPAALRYADLVLAPDGTAVWCVQERHDGDRVDRSIVSVPLDGRAADDPNQIRSLADGAQFLAFPTPSPDGRQLAWVCWNQPDMPWDATELRVGTIDPDGPIQGRRVLGGAGESVLAPCWRDPDRLYVVSDRSGWWNLYEVDRTGDEVRPLYPAAEEFGHPLWQLGGRPFALLGDGRLAVLHGRGDQRLGLLDPVTGRLDELELPYPSFEPMLQADGTAVVGLAGGPTAAHAVVRVETRTGRTTTLRRELEDVPDPGYLPTPRAVEFRGADGAPVHAIVYPPTHPTETGPAGTAPPYVAWAHGGPTGHDVGVLDLEKAYFTSRGIGIVDVNYGGSTGYGRAYRDRLRGQWGVSDVADVVAAAQALADAGLADPDRLAVRGASAGGWTALTAVTTGTARHGPVFRAAVSYFGVADLELLSEQLHDFEAHYLTGLVGPLPENLALYRERSPIGHFGPETCPLLLLQGADDPVVPPAQAEAIVRELTRYGIPHAYLSFDGESHGFHRAETRIACLRAELSFYGQTLGFTPADTPTLQLAGTGVGGGPGPQ